MLLVCITNDVLWQVLLLWHNHHHDTNCSGFTCFMEKGMSPWWKLLSWCLIFKSSPCNWFHDWAPTNFTYELVPSLWISCKDLTPWENTSLVPLQYVPFAWTWEEWPNIDFFFSIVTRSVKTNMACRKYHSILEYRQGFYRTNHIGSDVI